MNDMKLSDQLKWNLNYCLRMLLDDKISQDATNQLFISNMYNQLSNGFKIEFEKEFKK